MLLGLIVAPQCVQKRANAVLGVDVPVGFVFEPKLGLGVVPKLGVLRDGVENDGVDENVGVGAHGAFPKNAFTRVRVKYHIISPGMTIPPMLL